MAASERLIWKFDFELGSIDYPKTEKASGWERILGSLKDGVVNAFSAKSYNVRTSVILILIKYSHHITSFECVFFFLFTECCT